MAGQYSSKLNSLVRELDRMRTWYERFKPEVKTLYVEPSMYQTLLRGPRPNAFEIVGGTIMFGVFKIDSSKSHVSSK